MSRDFARFSRRSAANVASSGSSTLSPVPVHAEAGDCSQAHPHPLPGAVMGDQELPLAVSAKLLSETGRRVDVLQERSVLLDGRTDLHIPIVF